MNHIKDYWVESEVFHASNLNEIARAINELIDKAETSIIDDGQSSSASTYSSVKIIELLENYGFKTVVVDELPVIGENNTIYFVPSADPKEKNVTDEFIWCDGKWEQIGSTRVDFSNYYTKREIDDTVDAIEGMISDKADVQHEHQMEDVNGLSEALSGKSDTGHTHSEYSPTGHTHGQYSLTSHTHTAAEVGALPDTTVIPTKTSQLTNDSGFLTEHQELKTINGESLIGTGDVEINVIDDETPSTQKAYSSSKIEDLLKAPTVDEVIDVLNEP